MAKRDYQLEQRLEQENEEKLEAVYVQTREIRDVAERMLETTQESNSYLGHISAVMDKGKGGLQHTVSRFEDMLTDKNTRLSIYIAGVIVVSVVVLWKFVL